MKGDGSSIAYLKAMDIRFWVNTLGQVPAILYRDLIRINPKNGIVLLEKIHGIAAFATAQIQDFHILGKFTF